MRDNVLKFPHLVAMDSDQEPKAKRIRRGWLKQRLAAEVRVSGQTAVISSHLGRALLEKWAWGTMSPQEVQELASKDILDFKAANTAQVPADLHFLASLGSGGIHKSFDCKLKSLAVHS